MVFDPATRRSSYRSPEVVLAEARRMAADILRRAERDANDIRREAAEWASSARRDADAYRERVLGDVEQCRADLPGEDVSSPQEDVSSPHADVIDLRRRTEQRQPDPDSDPDLEPEPESDDQSERRAVGGSYVVGHAPPPVETSIDTKLHDVVRLAVRRTFHSRYP